MNSLHSELLVNEAIAQLNEQMPQLLQPIQYRTGISKDPQPLEKIVDHSSFLLQRILPCVYIHWLAEAGNRNNYFSKQFSIKAGASQLAVA